MSIIRTYKRENPFVQIDKSILSDENLSWKAKGILAYLLSKPHDWQTKVKDIEKRSTDGREAVRNGLLELEKCGYLVKEVARSGGKFNGWNYTIYETPLNVSTADGFPDFGKTDFGKTDFGKPDFITNNDITNNDITNNESNSSSSSGKSFQDVIHYYENEIGQLSPIAAQKIGVWIDDNVFEEPYELICYAIEIAVGRNKRYWNYVEGILLNFRKLNLKTLGQAQAHEKEFKRKQEAKSGYKRNTREEKVPKYIEVNDNREGPTEKGPEKQMSREELKKLFGEKYDVIFTN